MGTLSAASPSVLAATEIPKKITYKTGFLA
jgi:hypothetical protein